MAYYSIDEVTNKARGQWKDIMVSLGIFTRDEVETKKGIPCPACGGKDRFSFNDHNDEGLSYCRKCDLKSPIKVIERVKGCEFKEALKMVAEKVGVEAEKNNKFIIPCPKELDYKPNTYLSVLNKNGNPQNQKYTHLWPWYKADGKKIGYIGRKPNKITHQIFWTEKGWTQDSYGDNRPMFGSETLDLPDPVYVVEGEKTWQAVVDKVFNPVVTWVGGASAVANTNFSLLKGRQIILCPDNDNAGRKAMKYIENISKGSSTINIFKNPDNSPEKWDLADYNGEDLETFVKEHLVTLEEKKEEVKDNKQFLYETIRPLGFDDKKVYFMPAGKGQVIQLGQADLTESTLRILARDYLWRQAFPGKEDTWKTDYKEAACWILDCCEKLKVYDPSKLRGNGIWRDGEKDIVVHLGDKLLVNGEEMQLNQYESKYVYSQRPRKIKMPKIHISQEEKELMVRCAEAFNWKDKEAPTIVLSFIITSIMAAYLRWRPHVYITGPAGVGKSTVQEMFIQRCLEGLSIQPEGDTTEAGLRSWIKNDSLPVIFDEAEGDGDASIAKMKNVMRFARSNSSSSGGEIAKGSIDQSGVRYQAQSMFSFSSINTIEMQKQDRDRITKIELAGKSDLSWPQLEKLLNTLPRDMCEKLFLFVVTNVSKINNIIEAYKTYFADKFGSQRIGDQFGTLAVGKYLLTSDLSTPTMEEIKKMQEDEGFVWHMIENPVTTSEEVSFLSYLRNSVITVKRENANNIDLTVRDIVQARFNEAPMTYRITREEAGLTLKNMGIFVKRSENKVYFSITNERLKSLFDKRPMYKEFAQIMLRIEGAHRPNARKRLDGQLLTVVSLPIKTFLEDAEEKVDEDIPF